VGCHGVVWYAVHLPKFRPPWHVVNMCASYMIRARNPELIGLEVELRIDDFEQYCDSVIVPQRYGPAIKRESGVAILTAMRFALLPSWAQEPKVKFATHNARLETIEQKPTWKTVFVKKHCLIPLTDFIEPIYEGEFAGHMVAFSEKAGSVIFAAGVWDEWVNRETGEVIPSFSIITYEPPPFVAGIGHDRCPVFLNATAGTEWLANEGSPAQSLKEFLIKNKTVPELAAAKHRAMRPGWEKRK
jgi:putative SOS response-associated peptidase YedK